MTLVTQSNEASKHLPHLDPNREDGFFDSNDIAEDHVQVAEVTLTTAQLLALNTTPIDLVAAPGAGKYVIVDEVAGFNNHGGTDYAFGGPLSVRYTDESGDEAVTAFPEVAFAEASADAVAVQHGIDAIPVANAAVVLAADTSDPTLGDGTMTFQVKYRVVTLP